jgi:hypothetical protein
MSNTTGTIGAILDGVTMRQPKGAPVLSEASLFRTARDFFGAAAVLDPAATPAAFGLDAAQCLELALKACLLHTGATEDELKNKFSHRLQFAWSHCVNSGLKLDATMPTWALQLHAGHDKPYLFRYAQDNVGIVLAPKAQVVDGLRDVLAAVQWATGVT